MKLIIVIIYLHLPPDIHELHWWGAMDDCPRVGAMIAADIRRSEIVSFTDFYCVGDF